MNELMSPEEIEYNKYIDKMNSLDNELVDLQNELQNLNVVMKKFETRFVKKLASRYRIIDTLDAKLSQYKKKLKEDPSNFKSYEKLFEETEEKHKPFYFKNKKNENKDIKSLYREIVKKIHPDRSKSQDEEKILTDLMSQVNEAYRNNDKETMLTLYNNWQNDPVSIAPEDTIAQKLIKIIRKVYSKESDVKILRKEISKVKASEMFEFKIEVDRFAKRGVDIMREMSNSLDKEIVLKKKVVKFLELLEEANKKKS